MFRIALTMLMLTGVLVAPAAAQEGTPDQHPGSFEGVEKIYMRGASVDLYSTESPEDPPPWVMVFTMVYAFDTEEHAEAALERMADSYTDTGDRAEPAYQPVELDLDASHIARTLQEPTGEYVLEVVAHDGPYLYAVAGVSMLDPTPKVEALAKAMLDAEVSEAPEVFDDEGTSTGGLWAKLPSSELLREDAPELVDIGDVVIRPDVDEASPAS